ncbi:MAG: hypothetical protein IKK99_01180 [Oscillospiraceae bacterium]|nr:hypothetical protein [Oscillospiraceae bacterium]
MKNTLADLNNYLFEALERLNDDSLTAEQLETEIKRAKTVTDVGGKIIETGTLMFNVKKHMDEYGQSDNMAAIPVLGIGGGK